MAKQQGWKEKIIRDLKNYRSYKADIEVLEIEMESLYERNMGISYDKPKVQTSNLADDTADKALKLLDNDKREEYIEKKEYVRKLEAYVNALSPAQKFIIKAKFYMLDDDDIEDTMKGGETRRDIDIYNHHRFPFTRQYYNELRNKAYKYLAKKMKYM